MNSYLQFIYKQETKTKKRKEKKKEEDIIRGMI